MEQSCNFEILHILQVIKEKFLILHMFRAKFGLEGLEELSKVMEKFYCNLKCPFFLHTNFPMVLNDQKLWCFIKNKIFKIMTHS